MYLSVPRDEICITSYVGGGDDFVFNQLEGSINRAAQSRRHVIEPFVTSFPRSLGLSTSTSSGGTSLLLAPPQTSTRQARNT